MTKILWGMTGSVAAIRHDRLGAELLELGEVRAVLTERAQHFTREFSTAIETYTDQQEWNQWSKLGDPVLHIELRRWADIFLVAPASANCLAKMSNGICDSLLLSVARAWDFQKPVVVAPAMNTMMWAHPTTSEHLGRLRQWGVHIVNPVEKKLACEDVGMGAQAPAEQIAAVVAERLKAQGVVS